MTGQDINRITNGHLLARNTILNLVGQLVPMLMAVFAIPALVNSLGKDRFGILTLAWTVIGYFTLFDLGVGQALTKLFSEKLGKRQEHEFPGLFWTALILMIVFGSTGAITALLLTPWLTNVLKIPKELYTETLSSFYVLSFYVPIAISSAGLRGILEAHQRFDIINSIRVPMRIFTYIGPLLVLPFSNNLFFIVILLLLGEAVGWLSHLLFCFYIIPKLHHKFVFQRNLVLPLLRYGSWMTVSNVISPLIVTVDRFLLGMLISAAAVAYYATPYEMITKLWAIPSALVAVLFPVFSSCFSIDIHRTATLFRRSTKYIFLTLFPVILVIITIAYEILNWWLGKDFANNSTHVLQWLAVGVFINSLGRISSALVQGAGRPDITAKLHFIEVPIYLLIFWLLVNFKGVEGAAIAWVIRVTLDTFLLFIMTWKLLKLPREIIWYKVVMLATASVIFAIASVLTGLLTKLLFLFSILVVFILFARKYLLDESDKARIHSIFIGQFK